MGHGSNAGDFSCEKQFRGHYGTAERQSSGVAQVSCRWLVGWLDREDDGSEVDDTTLMATVELRWKHQLRER